MLERLPAQIDPFRFAETRRVVRGELPVAELDRLAPLLSGIDTSALEVVLEFGIDEQGVRFIKGTVRGELSLACQRCLEPMVWPVDLTLAVGLVRSDEAGERLPIAYEPLLIESVPMVLANVIEDELLLSLPLVPMHPEESCPATALLAKEEPAETQEGERENPFAVLSGLKHKND